MLPAPRTLVLLEALLAACGAEPVNYAELADICGAPSPARVLALAPDQALRDSPPIRVGDRVFYVISRLNDGDSDLPYSLTAESTVWTTGPCGESPRQVGAGIEHIFVLDRWPDLVLGCHKATGDVVVLDPDGEAAPRPLFPGVPLEWSCGLAWTEHGLLSVVRHDDELGALQLHPYPEDPRTGVSAPDILLDPIRVAPVRGGLGLLEGLLYSFPDHALALTPDGVLTRVGLGDRQVSPVQTGVIAFDASRDGRHLLWQDATRTGGDPERPEGKLLLRDRAAGSDVLLAQTWLGYSSLPLRFSDRGLIKIGLSAGSTNAQRVYFGPDLDFIDVDRDLLLSTPLADGRWLATKIFAATLHLVDLEGDEITRLFPRQVGRVGHDEDSVTVIERGDGPRDDRPMWRVPLDGAAATRIAERANSSTRRLADGAMLGAVGLDRDWLGALVLIEPGSRAELRIDDRVHGHAIDTARTSDEGVVRYSVSDGERSGVYLARLPPR